MKRPILSIAATCAALSLPALAFSGLLDEVSLVCTPKVGTELTKSYSTSLTMELVDMDVQILVDGEEQDGMAPDDMEMTMTESGSTTVVETITGMDGERVTGLSRKYESAEYTSGQDMTGPDGENQGDETKKESALEGKTILFKWDGEEDAWVASFPEDEEGEAELLEDLEGDSNLTWLLPGEPVEEGGSWELDVDAFKRTMDPFGEMHWDDDDDQADFDKNFEEGLEITTFTATLKGVDEGIDTVAFEIEAETSFEMVPDLEGAPEGLEVTNEFSFTFEFEGVLLWNIEANHATGMTAGGDLSMESTMHQTHSGQMDVEVTQIQAFEGEYSMEFTIE